MCRWYVDDMWYVLDPSKRLFVILRFYVLLWSNRFETGEIWFHMWSNMWFHVSTWVCQVSKVWMWIEWPSLLRDNLVSWSCEVKKFCEVMGFFFRRMWQECDKNTTHTSSNSLVPLVQRFVFGPLANVEVDLHHGGLHQFNLGLQVWHTFSEKKWRNPQRPKNNKI